MLSRPDQAAAWLARVLETKRRALGPDDPRLIGTLSQLGSARMAQGEHTAAEEAYREAIALSERTAEGGWLLSHTQSLLGSCLVAQRRFDEAEPLLLRGYQGLRSVPSSILTSGPTFVDAAARRLIHLYESWDRPEQAASWRAKIKGNRPAKVDTNAGFPDDPFASP